MMDFGGQCEFNLLTKCELLVLLTRLLLRQRPQILVQVFVCLFEAGYVWLSSPESGVIRYCKQW